jgi:hypothetical protein
MSLWKLLTAAYNSAGNSVKIRADGSTSSLQVVDYSHHEMHAGNHYFVKTWLQETGGTGATNYFAFTTPDSDLQIHAKAKLAPDVDTEVNIYENASVTGGVSVPGMNNCRCSTNVAQLLPLAAPTVVDPGDLMWAARNGGGRNAVGVAPGFNYEIIVKRATTYLFEIIKRTTADLIIDIDFFWYEHTPHNT